MTDKDVIVETTKDGRFWTRNGRLHRSDGPAVEWSNGNTEYWMDGQRHRIGGPAVVAEQPPALEGERPRRSWLESGTPRELAGRWEYWEQGCLHRTDGPAVEYLNGDTEYWVRGNRHRLDGPAVEDVWHRHCEYWVDGVRVDRETIMGEVPDAIIPFFGEKVVEFRNAAGRLDRSDGPAVVDRGFLLWFRNGTPHRVDGPCHVSSAKRLWARDGLPCRDHGPTEVYPEFGECLWLDETSRLHRVGGPAKVSFVNGMQLGWYHHGKRHRIDGPAWVGRNDKQFWLNDGLLHQQEFERLREVLKHTNALPISYVDMNDNTIFCDEQGLAHRTDGPAIIAPRGSWEQWFRHGLCHREDGPAFTTASGRREWWRNDQLHRSDGPAVIHANGTTEYWCRGVRVQPFGPTAETDVPAMGGWSYNDHLPVAEFSEEGDPDWL